MNALGIAELINEQQTDRGDRIRFALRARNIARPRAAFLASLSPERSIPNPDEVLQSARLDISAYNSLYTDPTVQGASEAFISGVMSYDWDIEKGKASEAVADALRNVFERMPMRTIISDMLQADAYGFSVQEINWNIFGAGKVYPEQIILKPHSWFGFDEYGALLFKSNHRPEGEYLPRRKFVVNQVEASYTNPYGKGNLMRCYWPVQIKKGLLKYWLTASERYGMPWPIFTYNKGDYNTTEKVNDLVESIFDMFADGILVAPSDVEAALHSTSAAMNPDVYKAFLHYCDAEINKIWLGHASGMEVRAGGLGDDDTIMNALDNKIQRAIGRIEERFNEIILWINEINFGLPIDELPYFTMRRKGVINKARLDRDTVLKEKHGVNFTKSYYEDTYELSPDSFELGPVQAPASPFNKIRFYSEPGDADKQDSDYNAAVDYFIDKATSSELAKAFSDGVSKSVLSELNNAKSFAEAEAIITKSFADMDTTEFERVMTSAIIAANVLGNVTGDNPNEIQ